MRETIKTIIFDYGNVIGSNPTPLIFESICKEFGVEYNKIKKEYHELIPKSQKDQISENEFWSIMSKGLGIEGADKLREVWIREYEKNSEVNKEVISFIRKLKNDGYEVCLLSNIANFYKDMIVNEEIKDLFSTTFYSFDIKARKTEKKMYEIIIDRLGVEQSQCIFIDEEEESLIVPKEIGMKTILFESLEKLELKLSGIL